MLKRPHPCGEELLDRVGGVQGISGLDDHQLRCLLELQRQASSAKKKTAWTQPVLELAPAGWLQEQAFGADAACMEQQRPTRWSRHVPCHFAWNCTRKTCTYYHPDGRSIDDDPSQQHQWQESGVCSWNQRQGHGPEAATSDVVTWPKPFDPVSSNSPGETMATADAAAEAESAELDVPSRAPAATSLYAPVKPAADLVAWLSPFDPVNLDEAAVAAEAAVTGTPASAPAAAPTAEPAVSAPATTPAAEHAATSARGGWPEMPKLIGGQGRFSGRPPRGAGIVAICIGHSGPNSAFVCVVEKANGKCGFPKGGRSSGETVWDGAHREWLEETGIPLARLQVQPKDHIDDAFLGVRYLIASCAPADAASKDPDACGGAPGSSWAPPNEDPSDPDPIVRARWAPLSEVLHSGGGGLRREYVEFVRCAARAVIGGDPHAERDERPGASQASRANARPRRWRSGAGVPPTFQ